MKKNKAEKHKRHSTAAIIFTGTVITTIFICMCVYMVRYHMTHKIEMFDNSYNSYQNILSHEILRGSIISSDGVTLAYSDTDTEKREYPFANEYSHAVGYATHGKMGIESLGNYYLLNSHSSLGEKIDADARDVKIMGDDVYCTLDTKLQDIAYNSLGVYQGAVLVTEVKTGRILAMVSKPDFDPNLLDTTWKTMLEDKENSQLLNRVTQGLYPPGSTFKIITSLEYIKENPDTYNNYSFNCTGRYTVDGNTIQCYHGSVHGGVNFDRSFAKSCNSSFANIGLTLDENQFEKTLSELMFNEELPVDFPYSKSTTGINSDISIHNMMQASIGQGQDSMSPLHLNMITCAIANKGILMRPHLIDSVKSNSGNVVLKNDPEKAGRIMTEDESDILTHLMVGVVQEGTGTRLKGLSYSAAGKTGSAEYNQVKGDSHAWFTGFAPAEDPEIALTIIIEGAGSGGDYAVPIAKRIFDQYFN